MPGVATTGVSPTVEVPQFQLSLESVDIPVVQQRLVRSFAVAVMAAMKVFCRFFRIFRAPPGCPGVERQFLETSMAKSSLPSRAPPQFHAQHLSTWKFCLQDRVKNNNNNAWENALHLIKLPFCIMGFLSY